MENSVYLTRDKLFPCQTMLECRVYDPKYGRQGFEAQYNSVLIAAFILILPGSWAGNVQVCITHCAGDTNRKFTFFSGRVLGNMFRIDRIMAEF